MSHARLATAVLALAVVSIACGAGSSRSDDPAAAPGATVTTSAPTPDDLPLDRLTSWMVGDLEVSGVVPGAPIGMVVLVGPGSAGSLEAGDGVAAALADTLVSSDHALVAVADDPTGEDPDEPSGAALALLVEDLTARSPVSSSTPVALATLDPTTDLVSLADDAEDAGLLVDVLAHLDGWAPDAGDPMPAGGVAAFVRATDEVGALTAAARLAEAGVPHEVRIDPPGPDAAAGASVERFVELLDFVGAAPAPTTPALVGATVTVDGRAVDYQLQAPEAPETVVVVVADDGRSAADTARLGVDPLSELRRAAPDAALVYLAAPTGTWATCRADDERDGLDLELDVAAVDAVLDEVLSTLGDPGRPVHLVGASDGGAFALAYSAARPERLASVAIATANLAARPRPGPCEAAPPPSVPTLVLHGDQDQVMPYTTDDGAPGCVPAALADPCGAGTVRTGEQTAEILGPGPSTFVAVVDADPGDDTVVIGSRTLGDPATETWLVRGGGHVTPSRSTLLASAGGTQSHDVEFARLVTAFVDSLG